MCDRAAVAPASPSPIPHARRTKQNRHEGNLDAAASSYFDGTDTGGGGGGGGGGGAPQPAEPDAGGTSGRALLLPSRRDSWPHARSRAVPHCLHAAAHAHAHAHPTPPLARTPRSQGGPNAVDKILSSAKENTAEPGASFQSPGHRLDSNDKEAEHVREVLCLFLKDGMAFYEDTSARQQASQERKIGMHTYDAKDEGPDLGTDGKEELARVHEDDPGYRDALSAMDNGYVPRIAAFRQPNTRFSFVVKVCLPPSHPMPICFVASAFLSLPACLLFRSRA